MKVRQTLFRRMNSVVLQIEKERTPPSRVRIKTRVPTSIDGRPQARNSNNFVQTPMTRRGRGRIPMHFARPPGRISEQAQYSGKAKPYDLIHKEKEQGRDCGQQEDHAGRDKQLAPRRPFDLGDFAPDFLHELQWRDLRHPVQPCASSERRDSRTEVELQSRGRRSPIPQSNPSRPTCGAHLAGASPHRVKYSRISLGRASFAPSGITGDGDPGFPQGTGGQSCFRGGIADIELRTAMTRAESPLDFIIRPFSFILAIVKVGGVLGHDQARPAYASSLAGE